MAVLTAVVWGTRYHSVLPLWLSSTILTEPLEPTRYLPRLCNTHATVWTHLRGSHPGIPVPSTVSGADGTTSGWEHHRNTTLGNGFMLLLWEGVGDPRSEFPIRGWVWQLFCLPPCPLLSPSTVKGGSKKALSRPWAGAAGTGASGCPEPELWANSHLLFVNYPVCGILLKQHKTD